MLDDAKVRRLQALVGVTADGSFGPNTLDATIAKLQGFAMPGAAAGGLGGILTSVPPPVPATAHLAAPAAFFAHMRGTGTLGPDLTQGEVDGCNTIMTACGEAGWPIADAAYALATAYHETAGTMQPIKELGGNAYYTRLYDIAGQNPTRALAGGWR